MTLTDIDKLRDVPESELIEIPLRDGVTVRARVAGEGPPLLLLGNMVSWEFWCYQIPFLAQHYRVIAPEYRAEPVRGERALDTLAADVPAILAALGYKDALLMGHSIGAMVLARVLETCPDVARAVVLANGFLELRLLPRSLHRLFHRWQPWLVPALWAIYPRLPWIARQIGSFGVVWGLQLIFLHREPNSEKRKMFFSYPDTLDGSMVLRLASALEYHRPPDLSRATMPVLLLSSADDHWMTLQETEALAERLPCCEHLILPAVGHMAPMIVPDTVNHAVLRFFREAEARVL